MRFLRSERDGSADPARWWPLRAALPGLLLALLLIPAAALSAGGADGQGQRPPADECVSWAMMVDGGGPA